MPTLYFLLYILAALAAYVFKLAYIGWFGGYFLAAVLILPPVLLILSIPSMLKTGVALQAPESCIRGSDAVLSVFFRSGRALPLGRVKLRLRMENVFTGESTVFRCVYRGSAGGREQIALPTESCGLVRCRVEALICYDMLGLIALRLKGSDTAVCLVLPRAAEPEKSVDIDAAMSADQILRPKYGGGYSEEHDLRAYQPGDTVGSIHWKLSSKTDEIIVREPLVNANDRVYVVLSGVGEGDQGLETLLWLSLELCRLEIAHTVVSGGMFDVENEAQTAEAMAAILSVPADRPCAYDRARARCVFLVSGREVRTG